MARRRNWKRGIENDLRVGRAVPPEGFVNRVVGTLDSSPSPRRPLTPRRLAAVVVAVVAFTMFAAFGGVGYAKSSASSAVEHTTQSLSQLVKDDNGASAASDNNGASTVSNNNGKTETPQGEKGSSGGESNGAANGVSSGTSTHSNTNGKSETPPSGNSSSGDSNGADNGKVVVLANGEDEQGSDDDPGDDQYQEKVIICHGAPPKDPKNFITLRLSAQGAAEHLANHPFDHPGPCT